MSTPDKKSKADSDDVINITPGGDFAAKSARYSYTDLVSPFQEPEESSKPLVASAHDNIALARKLLALSEEINKVEGIWPFKNPAEKAEESQKKRKEAERAIKEEEERRKREEEESKNKKQIEPGTKGYNNYRHGAAQIMRARQKELKNQYDEFSEKYKAFLDPPAKIYRKYYIFDVKNPKEFQQGRNKPILVEKGPYVYSLVRFNSKFI